ncbi:hypothetical protein D3C71_1576720 [compost metagenome]
MVLTKPEVPVGVLIPVRQLFIALIVPVLCQQRQARCRDHACTFGDGSRVVSQLAGQLAEALHPGIEERQYLGHDLHGT